jgi:DNA-directed RNA polymerase specialized sigma24 family protein
MAYFNSADISESIARVLDEIEKERDPNDRVGLLNAFMRTTSQILTSSLQRVTYDLYLQGITTSDIANSLGMSQRAVKRLIAGRARATGAPNPLLQHDIEGFVDIRELVKP